MDNGYLTYKDNAASISQDRLEIIFGTTYKLQYIDPFLFFAYEFRKRTLSDARLIVAVGYGFADDHINGILNQALKGQVERKLLVVTPSADSQQIAQKLDINLDASKPQIECWKKTAKEFLEEELTLDNVARIFPEETSPFEENVIDIPSTNGKGIETSGDLISTTTGS